MIANFLKTENIFYKDYEIINFINLNELEKELVLSWRNHEEVRKWMVNKEIISYEEHLNYINSLIGNDNKLCFIVKTQEAYIGVVEFDEIDLQKNEAYFGLNANLDNPTRGIGRVLEEISIYLAKEKLGLKKLKLYVYEENQRVINLHKKFGFEITEKKSVAGREAYFMESLI